MGHESDDHTLDLCRGACASGLRLHSAGLGHRRRHFVETLRTSENPLDDDDTLDRLLSEAEQGDVAAMYKLGRWSDGANQGKWFCLAANQGHASAQYKFGRAFETKSKPDYVTAFKWYGLATSGGLPAGPSAMDDVSKFMSPDQITEAKRLVAEWKPDPAKCEMATSPGS